MGRKRSRVYVELLGGPFDGAAWRWEGQLTPLLDLEFRRNRKATPRRYLYRLDETRCVVSRGRLSLAAYVLVTEGGGDASAGF